MTQIAAQPRLECADNLAFLRTVASESVHLAITSPPYNIGKTYEKQSPLAEYLDRQARVIEECVRVLSPQGSLCWQVGNYVDAGEVFPLDMELNPIFRRHGLKLRNRIVWHFEHGLHGFQALFRPLRDNSVVHEDRRLHV